MKNLIAVFALACAACTGFAQANDDKPRAPAAAKADKAESAKPSKNETAKTEAVAVSDTNTVASAKDSAVKPPRVLLRFIDGNPIDNPTTCKRYLQTYVEGELAGAGVNVVPSEPADISITGTLRGGMLNSRGRTVVWQVTADMHVIRLADTGATKVISKQRFDAKSGDARVASEAQKRCADRLGPDIVKFALEAVGEASGKGRE